MAALDALIVECERCVLSVGERVLFDGGDTGWAAGSVRSISEAGVVHVQIDGESSGRALERPNLLKAPAPTAMCEGQYVCVAYDHEDLPSGSMRWQYGSLMKVHQGGEVVDIAFDNGETAEWVPTHDVEPAT